MAAAARARGYNVKDIPKSPMACTSGVSIGLLTMLSSSSPRQSSHVSSLNTAESPENKVSKHHHLLTSSSLRFYSAHTSPADSTDVIVSICFCRSAFRCCIFQRAIPRGPYERSLSASTALSIRSHSTFLLLRGLRVIFLLVFSLPTQP